MTTQRQTATKTPQWDVIISLLVALLAAAPLWGPGMINTRGGGDSPFLLQRTMDIADSLSHGIFPVRWMAHAAYGLGYPFFNHYAALPYYISGGLTALGISPIIAIQTTQTLGFILAAFSMLLWAKRIYKSQVAVILSIIAYTLVPFHMVNVYVRGDSLSEFYAFIWYPLTLWALDRLGRHTTRINVATAGLAYGGLVLTHNVSAVIFSPFALLYILITKWIYQPIDTESEGISAKVLLEWSIPLALPFIAGILLTTLFWLPAIGELSYGQMGSEFTAGYFHYSNHFRSQNLVQAASFFDYGIAADAGEAGPFAMGLVQAILALAGAVSLGLRILVDKEIARKLYAYNLFGLFLATLMITPLSKPLWDYLPLLETTQFPWRFLSIQGLFTAITTGSLLEIIKNTKGELPKHAKAIQTTGLLCLGGLLIISTLPSLHPERLLITDQDINWENLLLYETFTGNIGTTIRYEYLPRDVVPRLYISEIVLDGQGKLIAQPGSGLKATLVDQTPVKQVWNITIENQSTPVTFPLNWWPGWQAKVNGVKTNTYPMPGSGRLTVDLPPGDHILILQLHNTPLRNIAIVISCLSLLAGIVLLQNDLTNLKILKWHELLILPLCLLLALGISAVFNHTQPLPQITTFDFNQIPYPHHGIVGFQDVQLTQVSPLPETASPGEEIDIRLQWNEFQNSTPITVEIGLVSPAMPRHNVPYVLAKTTVPLTSDTNAKLTIPGDIARGLYLVELHLYNQAGELYPHTEDGQGRGTVYISAIRVRQGAKQQEDSPVASFTDLTLHNLETTQPDQTTLQVKMHWSTPGTPHNWSLSLRLQDNNGHQIAQRDLQPGYGYLPTTLWEPGDNVTDYIMLEIPKGLATGDYKLQIVTYLKATMENGGETLIPIKLTQTTQKQFTGDALCEFESLALTNLELPEKVSEGNPLDFYVEWNTLRQPEVDYQAKWEVMDPAQQVIATTEGPLAPGSQTRDWLPETWVRAPVHIDLPTILTENTYTLKLSLVNENGEQTGCELPTPLAIKHRPRLFEIPEIPHPQEALFGKELRLLGYELAQDDNALLNITLWWQSTNATLPDYKRFIHFYSTANEQLLAQDDAIPRNWAYPTSHWVVGEVVSETVTMDLTAIEAGEYRIAVGWYNPETMERLEVQDAQGVINPAQRAVLDHPYIIK